MSLATLVAKNPEGLQDFWTVYERKHTAVRAATFEIVRSLPAFRPILASIPRDEIERRGTESLERLKRGVLVGDWSAYVAALEVQGTTYARRRVPFASWLEVARVVERVLLPELVAAYGENPKRLSGAIDAMRNLMDQGTAIIAERYAKTADDDRFHRLVDAVKEYAIFLLDESGRVATWNSGAEALKGWKAEEIIGKPFSLFFLEEERAARPAQALAAALQENRATDEGWRVRKDGSRFWASVAVAPMRDGDGALVGFANITRDLTDRKHAEQELRASEESLSTTLQSIGDGVIATDAEGRVTRLNPVAERLTGWTLAEARGLPFSTVFNIVNEITGEPAVNPAERVLREGVVVGLANHTSLIGRDGVVRPIADSAAPIRDGAGTLRGVVLVFRDMTAEREAERALHDAHAFLDSIVENIPHMIFVKDAADLRFRRFNRAGEELLGMSRDALLGRTDYDFFPKEEADAYTRIDREVLGGKRMVDVAEEPMHTSRGQRWLHTKKIPLLDDRGNPRFLLGISEDVTERKQMLDRMRRMNEELEQRVSERTDALRKSEEQLRQAQKMEAIGRLAGGIAHDFNNLLSVILSYGELMSGEIPDGDPVHAELSEIRRAAQRAADLTRQLLAFSRQQVLAPRVVDLNQIIAGMGKLISRLIGEDIEVCTVPAPGLHAVLVDPGQIEQVLMNLVVNARDAMPKGGRLTIETANVELDGAYSAEHAITSTGPHAMIAVSDTGIGMNRETLARIFEPFFTTKEAGKGTGLGLSTVFGIVKQSGGHIWVYSEIGEGTTFKLYFPRSGAHASDASQTHAWARPRGSETILLVEDEEQVRALLRTVLTRQGYVVHVAENGEAALAFAEKHEGSLDLMLTDLVMPKMNGRELAEKMAVVRPQTKVLFMSGYTDDTVLRHGVLAAGVAFLQKPITPDAVARKIRMVLDGG